MMNVVTYVRCSSDSGKAQLLKDEEILKDWARENNALIRKEFREVASGTSMFEDRPSLASAIIASEVCDCEWIIVPNIITIGRNVDSLTDCINACTRAGARVYFVKEKVLGGYGASIRAARRILERAEKEEDKILRMEKEMKRGRKAAKKKGTHMGRRKGSVKSDEQFLNEYSDVLDLLKQGVSIRKTAQIARVSPGTVQKMKNKFINTENKDGRD